MKVFYSDQLLVPLPDGHRFPMPKYGRLHARIVQARIEAIHLCSSSPAKKEQVVHVHSSEYFSKIENGTLTDREIRRIGLPWSPALFNRTLHAIGGTIDACSAAVHDGISANLAGGTHHAHRDHGEGYCIFNDVAIAARVIQSKSPVNRILIIDCDAHQGNGTAEIFSGDSTVFTYSIHGEKNFPYYKATSDLDVALKDGCSDQEYLSAVYESVPGVILDFKPDLVFYIAGADPYLDDRLGRLKLTKQGLAMRDRWVLSCCRRFDLPVAIVLGGGYARLIDDVVDIHFETIRIAAEIWKENQPSNHPANK